jgi:hypothetical protein
VGGQGDPVQGDPVQGDPVQADAGQGDATGDAQLTLAPDAGVDACVRRWLSERLEPRPSAPRR